MLAALRGIVQAVNAAGNLQAALDIIVERIAEVIEKVEQIEEEPGIILEPVKVNNEILKSAISEDDKDNGINPLLRNSLITFALILVIIASALFIMKRR